MMERIPWALSMEVSMALTSEARPARLPYVPLLALLALVAMSGAASSLAAQAARAAWQVPRTADGRPDFQGNWTNITLTPFQRAEGRGPTYTWEEVRQIEEPDDDCPPNPGTVACGRTPGQGNSDEARLSGNEYNEVYWERGTKIAVVNGEPRTSLITHPSDGRIPARTAAALQAARERADFRSQFAQYDHPELRPFAERCILFGSPLGPPMQPVGAYNSNYTIVQTADYLVLQSEMVHDVRIIRIGDPDRIPEHVRPYFGDSWGHWEGDVLVVETTNISADQAVLGGPLSEDAKVTERFSRVDAETILYEFTVDDAATFTAPFGGQIPIKRFDAQLYEYACHEGNYSLQGVLSGARFEEARATEN
jgi:hypothetical protein